MRQLPKISAIITYHNEGDLLSRALDSIDRQTYQGPVEVVVIDDASDVPLDPIEDCRFRVDVVRSDDNIHLPAARNLGFKKSAGELVCFLDADDEFLPEKFERQVAFLLERPEVHAVVSSYIIQDGERQWTQVPELVQKLLPNSASRHDVLPNEARLDSCLLYLGQIGVGMFRRAIVDTIGGFVEDYKLTFEDADFWVRLTQVATIGYTPEPTMRYIRRDHSMTRTLKPEKYVYGAMTSRRWRRIVAGLPPGHRRALRWKEAESHLLAAQVFLEVTGRPLPALGHALRSLLVSPSLWGVRSSIRSGLHALVPCMNSAAQRIAAKRSSAIRPSAVESGNAMS